MPKTKRPVGRPRIFDSPEAMEEKIEAYFAACRDTDTPITLTGLIFSIGLSSRENFDEYGRRPEFYDSVKRAKLACEMTYEQNLHGTNAAGSIFALKNFGWKDKQEHNVNITKQEDALNDLE